MSFAAHIIASVGTSAEIYQAQVKRTGSDFPQAFMHNRFSVSLLEQTLLTLEI